MPFSPEATIGYSDPNAVLYVLELRDLSQAKNKQFVSAMHLPLVQSISFNRQEASSFDWTLGEKPIREFAGIRESMITINGRSGLAHRLGRNAKGHMLFASGAELFQELEKFLENYQTEALQRQTSDHEFFNTKQLYLRCFFEDKHLKVEPVSFSFNRSTGGSRFSYEYTIQFRSYGEASKPEYNFMATMITAAQAATRAVDAATAYIAFSDGLVSSVGSSVRAFVEPVRAVRRMMEQVSSISGSAEGIVRSPESFAEEAFRTINAGITATTDLAVMATSLAYGAGDEAINEIQKAQRSALQQMGIVRRATLNVLGAKFGRIADSEDQDIPLAAIGFGKVQGAVGLGTVQGVATVALKSGQDLKDVAAEVYGTESLWTVLASVNGLSGINETTNGSPLYPGYTLVVPLFDGKGLPAPTGATELSPESVYGVDLKLTEDGDLFDSVSDCATLRGVPLLRQALTVRLLTAKGEHGVFPNYGLPRLVGEPSAGSTPGMLAANANEQMLADPRISQVSKVILEDLGDTISVECLVHTIGGPDIPVAVAVER